MDWMQDRTHWQAFVNMVLNFWSFNGGEFIDWMSEYCIFKNICVPWS
jgi:hypothetical protein